jgi:hypothetical protein
MEKQEMAEKTADVLRPFETANLIDTMQHLSVQKVMSHPLVLVMLLALFFFGVFRRSKPVLLTLFSLICIALIIRFAMPTQDQELSMSSMLPFIGGGLVIGCVIIYFSFIKSE